RVAYAASFGTSEWEFTNEQTRICAEIVQRFDAVSVREDSAVGLCEKYFGKEAVHVLDPTMLWDKEFYDEIVKKEGVPSNQGTLKAFTLDKSAERSALINYVEARLGLEAFEVMPRRRIGRDRPGNLLEYQFPSPLQWLKGYQDAQYV